MKEAVAMKKSLFLIQIMVVASCIYAIDTEMYGEIDLGIWLEQRERWYNDTNEIDTSGGDSTIIMGKDSLPVFSNSWIPSGKFGWNIKSDKWSGCIELGITSNIYDAYLSGVTGLRLLRREGIFTYLKKWYTQWYINDYFSFVLGQDYVPMNLFWQCNQVYYDWNCLTNLGATYTGRKPMVQVNIGGEINSSFSVKGKVAFIRTDTSVIAYNGNLLEAEVESRFPKIEGEIAADFSSNFWGIKAKFAGGFQQQYSLLRNDPTLTKKEFRGTVPAYAIGGEIAIKVGPVTLAGTFSNSMNPAIYGIASGNRWEWASGNPLDPSVVNVYYPYFERIPDTTGTGKDTYERRDSRMFQFAAILKVKLIDILGFEAGYGFQTVDHDFEQYLDMWDDRFAWYFQTEIGVFGNTLRLIPEVGQFYWGAGYMQGGRHTYGGIMTSVEF